MSGKNGSKNGSPIPNPRLPRLNRAGKGLRKHRLNPESLKKVVVEEEIEALKAENRTANGRRRPKPGFKRAPPEVKKDGLINLKAFGDPNRPDPKGDLLKEKVEDLNQEMLEDGRRSRGLILEEKIFILDAYYTKNWGPKRIGKFLGRPSSTISRFLDRYRSTASMAKLHMEAQAENLAKRVTAKANVEEAMEVLDRLDVLPKKDRKTPENTSFNIIVGMPGAPGTRGAIPVPSQKQIEAARIPEEE